MESGRFFFKGEAKGCSTVECTWITEFSEPLEKFNFKEQDVLFAMADVEPPAPIDTTVAKNDKPVADTTAVVKETPPPPPQRIPVLAAGEVAAVVKNNPGANTPSSLDKNNSIMIKQNEIPEKRLPVLLSGGVVALNTNISATAKTPVTLLGTEAMSVKENVVPEKRIPVLQSGDVVSAKNNTNNSAQNPPSSLNATSSITVKQNEVPEQKFEVLPAGDIVLAAHTSAIALKKTTYPLPVKNTSLKVKVHENTPVAVQKTLPPKDTAAALPTGYAERKKNVIRTLTVNTDSIMLRVYDNGVVDGDIVSVIYNDKVVIDKLSLTSHAVEVKIPVTKTGINTLVFHAHNLGEFPPNTALLEVLYGDKKEELTVSSDLTVSSAIDIEYQQ